MSRSKKIFAILALVFFSALAYVVYDISSRTTFPGSRKTNDSATQSPPDSIGADSVHGKAARQVN